MALPAAISDIAARFDDEITRLQDYGLDMSKPGWVERLAAKKQEMAEKHAAEELIRVEIDRALLPELMALYETWSAADRNDIRELLRRYGKVRWTLGNSDPGRLEPRTAGMLRERLLLLVMKDGLADWRDESVYLDKLCAKGAAIGVDMAEALRSAAELAGADLRGGRPSVRETLIERAAKL